MKRYNYFELSKLMEHVALSHPFVNNVYFDRYRLNDAADIEYPAIVFFHNHADIAGNTTTYSFSIMYVDRLLEDRSNDIQIQSLGKQVITELLSAIRDNFDIDTEGALRFNIFKNQYADGLAGAVCNTTLTAASDIGECEWLNIGGCDHE